MPKLEFHPRAIALDFDAAYASVPVRSAQANELSRETILNQFDLDEALEAELRKREMVEYDHIFQTQVPFSTPEPGQPAPGQPARSPQPQHPASQTVRTAGGQAGRRRRFGVTTAAAGATAGEQPQDPDRANRHVAPAA
jgi:hypothetical protein